MKSHRFIQDDMTALGRRLDAVRDSMERSRTPWARNHWQTVLNCLELQWTRMVVMYDAHALTTTTTQYDIDYGWFTPDDSFLPGYGLADRVFDRIFRADQDMSESWERHRDQRLVRAAQYGV